MNPVDPESREYPPCGYGLLGLCCSGCLRGPCRISPFDETRAPCGADSDRMVAGNLCRLVAGESARVLNSLICAVDELRKKSKAPPKALTESLARKYGIPRKEVTPFLKKETAKLLDPFADPSPIPFSSLFPVRNLHGDHTGRRSGPLLRELFGLLKWKEPESTEPEVLLLRCLDSAACMLIAEELSRDILLLRSGLAPAKNGRTIPLGLPKLPQPVLLSLFDTKPSQSGEMHKLASALKEISGVLSITLRGTRDLIWICKSLTQRWCRPIPDLPVAALVESQDILPVLAPLALGLPTASDPSLPIQGSKKVEDFFYSGLSKTIGNFYLPAKDETALARLSRVLGSKL